MIVEGYFGVIRLWSMRYWPVALMACSIDQRQAELLRNSGLKLRTPHVFNALSNSRQGHPVGTTWSWKKPKIGNSGTVTPTSKAERAANDMCRSFTETITLRDGRTETINGNAYNNPNGSWTIA